MKGLRNITEQIHEIVAYVETGKWDEPIKAKFFYKNNKVFYEVTKEICEGIEKYNRYAQSYIDKGKYFLLIPITYKDHYAIYSNGFGDTHYFVEHEFDRIDRYIRSFPLKKCTLTVKKVKNIDDLKEGAKKQFILQKLANKH